MGLRFWNTLSGQLEEFEPLEPGKVRMYNCGPTVYGRQSIGNFRSFLFADVLKRYLIYRGFDVDQVMNITDVGHLVADRDEGEDKLEKAARSEGKDPWQIARHYEEVFKDDLSRLLVSPARVYPRATDHIEQMKGMVAALIESGFAYEVNGNVYYDVTRFPAYGRLSKNTLENLEAGKRIEIHPDKRNAADFALWKSDEAHLMKWDSPWTKHGFPGWHIECSAMAREHLGDTLDIHTGGEDNIFPHHECEIAQSEAFSGQTFVKYWLHAKFLQVDGGKMGKSLGNVYSLDDVAKEGFSMRALRYALIRGHYRQPLNFTWVGMQDATSALDRLQSLVRRLEDIAGTASAAGEHGVPVAPVLEKMKTGFETAMDDDLNISEGLAAVFDGVSDLNRLAIGEDGALEALDAMRSLNAVLGVLTFEGDQETDGEESDAIQALVDEREAARKARDFARADAVRDELVARGVVLEDTPGGPRWHIP